MAFDFSEEKKFSYAAVSIDEVIRHFSKFIAGIWQIHPFGEGNTRTTSTFAMKYLRTLGFDVDNDIFYDNSYYFRNALVRANYSNIPKGIEETTEYLERFFRNALMGEENKLQSRFLLVGGWKGDPTPTSKSGTPTSKPTAPTSNAAKSPASKTLALSRAVRLLLDVLDGEMSRAKAMKAIGIKDRVTFTDYYLSPALKLGLVEMTQPNSPRSPTQKYRRSPNGLAAKGGRK